MFRSPALLRCNWTLKNKKNSNVGQKAHWKKGQKKERKLNFFLFFSSSYNTKAKEIMTNSVKNRKKPLWQSLQWKQHEGGWINLITKTWIKRFLLLKSLANDRLVLCPKSWRVYVCPSRKNVKKYVKTGLGELWDFFFFFLS